MKTRRHHNNKGTRQIQRGKCEQRTRRLAKKLGVAYGEMLWDDTMQTIRRARSGE